MYQVGWFGDRTNAHLAGVQAFKIFRWIDMINLYSWCLIVVDVLASECLIKMEVLNTTFS